MSGHRSSKRPLPGENRPKRSGQKKKKLRRNALAMFSHIHENYSSAPPAEVGGQGFEEDDHMRLKALPEANGEASRPGGNESGAESSNSEEKRHVEFGEDEVNTSTEEEDRMEIFTESEDEIQFETTATPNNPEELSLAEALARASGEHSDTAQLPESGADMEGGNVSEIENSDVDSNCSFLDLRFDDDEETDGIIRQHVRDAVEACDGTSDDDDEANADAEAELKAQQARSSIVDAGYDSDEGRMPNQPSNPFVVIGGMWNPLFPHKRHCIANFGEINAARLIAKNFAAARFKSERVTEGDEVDMGSFKAREPGYAEGDPGLSSKILNSFAMIMGGNGVTHNQFGGLYSFMRTTFKCLQAAVAEELLSGIAFDTQEVRDYAERKVEAMHFLFDRIFPMLSLANVKKKMRLKAHFFKVKSRKVHCVDENGEKSRTRVGLVSDIIALDLACLETCRPLLNRERPTAPNAPIPFYDCPLVAEPWLLERPAPFGALADATGGKAAVDFARPIPALHTAKLFAQGSLLDLHMTIIQESSSRARRRKRAENLIQRVPCLRNVPVKPVGDPFIFSSKLNTFQVGGTDQELPAKHLNEWLEPGDVAWPVLIDFESMRENSESSGQGTMGSAAADHGQAKETLLLRLSEKCNVLLCYSFSASEDVTSEEGSKIRYLKSLLFVAKDRNAEDRASIEGNVSVQSVEVLENPPDWIKGEIRPRVGPLERNPYRTIMFEKNSGAQIVVIPIILYTDEFTISDAAKTNMGGIYFVQAGMDTHLRTGAQSVRIASAVSNGIDADTVLMAMIDDLEMMQSRGKLMHTAMGTRWVFVKVVGINVDYVQASKSSHSMNHNSTAPCTICSLRRGELGYARHITPSGNSSLNLFISIDRLDALTERGFDKNQFAFFGVKEGAQQRPEKFLKEWLEMEDSRKVHRAKSPPYNPLLLLGQCSGNDGRFDYTGHTLPAPDHCAIFGLGKGSLNFVFGILQASEREIFHERLLMACSSAGLATPKRATKNSASVQNGFIAGLSVTHVASLLLMAPVVIASMKHEIRSPKAKQAATSILSSASELIALMYFTPRPVSATMKEAERRHKDVRQISDLAASHMNIIRIISTSRLYSPSIRATAVRFCDAPNLHRFFEICCFWFPAVGYDIFHITEIMFEKAHQFLKSYAKYTPDYECSGDYAMKNCFNDEALRRLALGFLKQKGGPDGVYKWNGTAREAEIFASLRPFYNPRSDKEDSAVQAFLTLHGERIWRGTKKAEMKTSADAAQQAASEMGARSGGKALRFAQARFGVRRGIRHNIIRLGDVISGITTTAFLQDYKGRASTHRILRMRSPPPLELFKDQQFGEVRVSVLVQQIWECESISLLGAGTMRLWVKGYLLEEDNESSTSGFPIRSLRRTTVWLKLDASCRRHACIPYVQDRKGDRIPVIKASSHKDELHDKYIVLGQADGYPSRTA